MPLQSTRWRQLLKSRMEEARTLGLEPEYVKAIYDVIHNESVRRQSEIVSGESGGHKPGGIRAVGDPGREDPVS
jgi:chorismate mutase